MAYRALYRIYRPSLFNEVAGQSHITEVLRNQVKLGCLSHAYLFCGPRGTGKTTMAKILSRAVNCSSPVNGEPCGECEMCRISSALNGDIMEIDAASNNGVDNVRDLIDQAQFAPLQLKKRVFIIDEVHMLSVSAFNALLKTLEEPPEHVLFILATTEPEKLLATIISRCQRFDFKRLTMTDIVDYMAKVLTAENVTFEKEALRIIAHAADGGMRDALSLLNQCISVAGNSLTVNNVSEVLGTVNEDIVFSMAEKIILSDSRGCLEILDSVVRSGKDLLVFTNDLSAHMRALLLTGVCGKCADLLEITEDAAARYEKQSRAVSKDSLLYYCEELVKTRTSIRYFPNPRMLLETALLRMACPEKERGQEAILARLADLEKKADPAQIIRLAELEKRIGSAESIRFVPSQASEKQLPADEPPFDMDPEPQVFSGNAADINKESFGTPVPAPAEDRTPPWETEESTQPVTVPAQPVPEPVPEKPVAPAGPGSNREAEALYAKFRKALASVNVMAERALSGITEKELAEDKLILYYDPQNPGGASMLKNQLFQSYMQQAGEKVIAGLRVVLQEKKQTPLSGADARLKELFGDKLTIE